MSLHPEFVHQVTGVMEKIFSSPDIEVELSTQVKKRCHEVQLSVFNKLQTAAMLKLEELDEFVGLQVDVRYNEFSQRVRGVEFSRLLREGSTPSAQATSTGAPPPPRSQNYKPVEVFIEVRKKPFPWFTVTSTSVSADDRDCITD